MFYKPEFFNFGQINHKIVDANSEISAYLPLISLHN